MTSIGFSIRLSLIALLMCIVSGSGYAQQPTQAQATAIRNSCRNDYMAHCSSVPSGTKESLQCLAQNMSSLSPPCASAVQTAVPPPSSATPANAPAATKPPPSASGTPPAASAAPRPMTAREEAMLLRRSCGGDFRAYCSGVQLGGGRAAACLMQNQARLSQPCKTALDEHAAQ